MATSPAPMAPAVGSMVRWGPTTSHFSGDVADGLEKAARHPADGGEELADRQAKAAGLGGGNPMFTLTHCPPFELMINLVTDPAGLFDRLLHGKDKAGNRLIGEVIEPYFFK